MDGGGRNLFVCDFATVVATAPCGPDAAFVPGRYAATRVFLVDWRAGPRWLGGLARYADRPEFGDRRILVIGEPPASGLFSPAAAERLNIVTAALPERTVRSIAARIADVGDGGIAMCPPPADAHLRFALRTFQDIDWCCTVISRLFGLSVQTTIGFRELLANAVEHGNLEITSREKTDLLASGAWYDEVLRRLASPEFRDRYASLSAVSCGRVLTLRIADRGQGFDWRKVVGREIEPSERRHSRGIALAEAARFRSFNYVGDGNEVVLEIDLAGESR